VEFRIIGSSASGFEGVSDPDKRVEMSTDIRSIIGGINLLAVLYAPVINNTAINIKLKILVNLGCLLRRIKTTPFFVPLNQKSRSHVLTPPYQNLKILL
jgi:hypothetical protein